MPTVAPVVPAPTVDPTLRKLYLDNDAADDDDDDEALANEIVNWNEDDLAEGRASATQSQWLRLQQSKLSKKQKQTLKRLRQQQLKEKRRRQNTQKKSEQKRRKLNRKHRLQIQRLKRTIKRLRQRLGNSNGIRIRQRNPKRVQRVRTN